MIRIEPPDRELGRLVWLITARCDACNPKLWIQVPVSENVVAHGLTPELAAFSFLMSRGWQIEPSRCPEHARVVV